MRRIGVQCAAFEYSKLCHFVDCHKKLGLRFEALNHPFQRQVADEQIAGLIGSLEITRDAMGLEAAEHGPYGKDRPGAHQQSIMTCSY